MFVQCPDCLKRYRLNESQAKLLRIKCRSCGSEFLASPSAGARHELAGNGLHSSAVVADIQRDFRNALVEILHRFRLHLVLAEDGQTALAEILAIKPRLLLVNPYLPNLMGTELISHLRAEVQNPPTIILLGAIHNSKRYRRRPESLYGADDYLDEGGSDEAIIRKIEFHLQLPPSEALPSGSGDQDALRLARSVFADLLVHDPQRMARVKTPDDFFHLFREEAAEGQRYIEARKRGASGLLREVVTRYVSNS
jgi:DNA-binding response OmpR family regulator